MSTQYLKKMLKDNRTRQKEKNKPVKFAISKKSTMLQHGAQRRVCN